MRKSMVWVCLLVALSIGAFAAAAQAGTVSSGDVMDVTGGLPGPNVGRYTIDDAGDLTLNIGGTHTPTACFPGEVLDLLAACDLVAFFPFPGAVPLDASGKFVGELLGIFPPTGADTCPVPAVLLFGPASGCFLINGH